MIQNGLISKSEPSLALVLHVGRELPVEPYSDFYDPESVFELDINPDQVRDAKSITFPHGETYLR